jgi:hypothetical protein
MAEAVERPRNGKPQKAISGPVGGFSIKMQHYVTKGVAIERHNPKKEPDSMVEGAVEAAFHVPAKCPPPLST